MPNKSLGQGALAYQNALFFGQGDFGFGSGIELQEILLDSVAEDHAVACGGFAMEE